MKPSESVSIEGVSTCNTQVNDLETLLLSLPSGNVWSVLQNNNNNEYYLSLADGSYNNNNKNNNYWVVPCESADIEDVVFAAEEDCWSNKHSSWDASKYHYHIGRRVYAFIESLKSGSYKPWRSICFIVLKPRPREVFAAHYQDRIAHHIAAPYMLYIAEMVHRANGDISFGNRKGKSAYHACLRLKQIMAEYPNGIVASYDIKSFFMSIKKEVALEIFRHYERIFRPNINEDYRRFVMQLIDIMVMHNPASNCERHSADDLWSLITEDKSLFYMDGLPIGNYYAQILANLILAVVYEDMAVFNPTNFVDDVVIVVDSNIERIEFERVVEQRLNAIGLKLHQKKKYVQPVRNGVKWCGYVVYPNRVYLSNRTIRNCFWMLKTRCKNPSLSNARKLVQSLNSYTGLMSHCNEWKAQLRLSEEVMSMGYERYLETRYDKNHIIFELKKECKRRSISEIDIKFIKQYRHMIVIPIKADSKHYEVVGGLHTYRYGYRAIEGDDKQVFAAVEESKQRFTESKIREKVTTYCAQIGIPNEYNKADYGY